MNITIDISENAISLLTSLLAWVVVIFFGYQIYKNQVMRPKWWKILIVLIAGLFSFSIDFYWQDKMFKLPILPIGVGILYFILNQKENSWSTYRRFAWLGFIANFIFLLFALAAILVQPYVYPKSEPSTYISNVDHAVIIPIHPSAKSYTVNLESLKKQLPLLKQHVIQSDQWYYDIVKNTEPHERKERFPYLLTGTSAKWGSGLHPIVLIENDGKGILLSTPQKQLYFRSQSLLLKEGK